MLTYLHPEAVKKFLRVNSLKDYKPTLEFLTKLGRAFQKMPYENMTKIIRSHSISGPEARIRLPELLYEEFLRFGTGGTCFSMTYFMQTILRSLGFETYPVMADRPLAPDTHCASVIIIDDKKYLLDPGFMIDRPLPLTEIPQRHSLRHNMIIIGLKGTIPIPPNQMKYFKGLSDKLSEKIVLPYESEQLVTDPNCSEIKEYTIATFNPKKHKPRTAHYALRATNHTIRYFLKDDPVEPDRFLELWLDSFNWTTLKNISITIATDGGYIYARNNFLRTTTKDGRTQERIKKWLDLTLGKTFSIDPRIINDAFGVLGSN